MEEETNIKARKLVSAGFLLKSKGLYLIGCPSHRTGTTGGWGIPKGRQDPGETIRATALREFYEETNLDIRSDSTIVTDWEPFFNYGTEGKDDTGKFKKTVYVFRAYDQTAKLADTVDNLKCLTFVKSGAPEIAEYKWATPEEAYDMVVKSQKGIFEFIIKYNTLNKKNECN